MKVSKNLRCFYRFWRDLNPGPTRKKLLIIIRVFSLTRHDSLLNGLPCDEQQFVSPAAIYLDVLFGNRMDRAKNYIYMVFVIFAYFSNNLEPSYEFFVSIFNLI